jgi:hypothetical protein
MRKTPTLFFILLPLLLLGACNKQIKPTELASGIEIGHIYYTQFNLYQENNEYRTTNYRKGTLIPINTAVILVSIGSKKAELKLVDAGQPLIIENMPKHTGNEDIQTAFKKTVAPFKVDLSAFTKAEQANIQTAQVKKGMGKKAVLAAIGFPPQVQTPSLEGDDWTYWSNRFNRFAVHFNNGKVDSIVD